MKAFTKILVQHVFFSEGFASSNGKLVVWGPCGLDICRIPENEMDWGPWGYPKSSPKPPIYYSLRMIGPS